MAASPLPPTGTLYALPVRVGDYVKVGDRARRDGRSAQGRVRAFIDEPELGGLEPGEPVRITLGRASQSQLDGQNASHPKQVVARGARSVGELLAK